MPSKALHPKQVVVPILAPIATALAPHLLTAITLDLADQGIRPTPLNVISYAIRVGIPEDIAAMVDAAQDADAYPCVQHDR